MHDQSVISTGELEGFCLMAGFGHACVHLLEALAVGMFEMNQSGAACLISAQ